MLICGNGTQAAIKHTDKLPRSGSPVATGPWPVRNQATQKEVSSRLKPKLFHLPPPPSLEKLSPVKPVPGAKKVGDRCHRWYAAAAVYLLSRLILCNPTDYSLPGSSVHGILQARILEWVAISFSRGIFPSPGTKPESPACQAGSLPLSHHGSLP